MPEIISMEGQVGVGYRVRALEDIDGIAVHYTVTEVSLPLNVEAEKGHVKAIDIYHSTLPRGWGGIGYHFLLFDSGRIYGMGSLRCQRAGVASENQHLVHMAFVTKGIPSEAAQESGRWLIGYIESRVRVLAVKGHRQWADASDPTDCPGQQWASWLPRMVVAAEAEGDMATEWENYTRGLMKEAMFFEDVKANAVRIEAFHRALPSCWRRSDSDPPLDHEYVYQFLPALCDRLIASAQALKKRATDRGF